MPRPIEQWPILEEGKGVEKQPDPFDFARKEAEENRRAEKNREAEKAFIESMTVRLDEPDTLKAEMGTEEDIMRALAKAKERLRAKENPRLNIDELDGR